MKLHEKLLAFFISSAMAVSFCTFPSAYTAFEPYIAEETFTGAESLEESADILRNAMKNRQDSVVIAVSPKIIPEGKSDIDSIVKMSFKETGVPDEGDYLRFGIYRYRYNAKYDETEKVYNITFQMQYNTTLEQEQAVTNRIESMMNEFDLKTKKPYERIKIIYDYVTENVSYDNEHDDTSEDRTAYSAYGALINGVSLCQGNAQLMYRLLTMSGISSRIIPGKGNDDANHAWNIARIGRKYYYLDSTWDEGFSEENYRYFMRGSQDFDSLSASNTHTLQKWDGTESPIYSDYETESFSARYPVAESSFIPFEYTLGDIDENNAVDARDATAVLVEYAEMSTSGETTFNEKEYMSADVNNDGVTDSSDASHILAYYSYVSTGGKADMINFLKDEVNL